MFVHFGLLIIALLSLSACSLDINVLGKSRTTELPSTDGLFPLGEQKAYFGGSIATATDSNGNVYNADATMGGSITKLNSSLASIAFVAQSGTGDGQVSNVTRLLVDSQDNLFVLDAGNDRIQKFDSSGAFVLKWGSSGSSNDYEFPGLAAFAIDSQDEIYVLVSDGATVGEVRVYNSSGVFQRKWGTFDMTHTLPCDACFHRMRAVAIDSSDNVYVADSEWGRIEKFDRLGNKLSEFGSSGTGNGQFPQTLLSMAIKGNELFLAEQVTPRIQKFNLNTESYVSDISSPGSADNQIIQPVTLNFDKSGYLMVSDISLGTSGSIKRFATDGTFISKTETGGSGDGKLKTPTAGAAYKNEFIVVVDSGNKRIAKFDAQGNWIMNFGSPGTGSGQFTTPFNVGVDDDGNIYVLDLNQGTRVRVEKFDKNGNFLTEWDGSDNVLITNAYAMAVAGDGTVYVGDASNGIVQKFDRDGHWVRDYTGIDTNTSTATISMPGALALDNLGHLLVSDMSRGTIIKVNLANDTMVTEFGSSGGVFGMTITPAGNILTSNAMNNVVTEYSSAGTLTGISWGGSGFTPGKLSSAWGIFCDPKGYVYVVDQGNSRIQKFNSLGVVQ
ncbi:NHL repeat-containing protein [Bdellovibrio sp. SKB1291214]|uniref:NHL repeat-containing protein n=1 Tax=Bdellovibrio sp. SKB1291214 TaxID=1732569 RepID=UPI002240904C|nr:NHL repeat-containing protein [Bdellovibrio sp. SKB1291214]UYL10519.1 NHL repeat-containing protein [Bdellovibrio sp. SKB1291214]